MLTAFTNPWILKGLIGQSLILIGILLLLAYIVCSYAEYRRNKNKALIRKIKLEERKRLIEEFKKAYKKSNYEICLRR